MCPPERLHSGVSIPNIHAWCAGILTTDAPLWGGTGGHIGTAPTHLHQTMRCAITSLHCTFDSSKPRGVPLSHRGYTFDSAGLASATQPTLGNNAGEEATPLGVVLFSSPIITTRGEWMIFHTKIDFKKYNADGIGSPPRLYPG